VDLAVKEKDHASQIFLDWFVNEQVEEEANMENWLVKIRMSGAKGHVLFILDSHAGERKK